MKQKRVRLDDAHLYKWVHPVSSIFEKTLSKLSPTCSSSPPPSHLILKVADRGRREAADTNTKWRYGTTDGHWFLFTTQSDSLRGASLCMW